MAKGWRHRIAGIVGSAGLTAIAVAVASHPVIESMLATLPLLRGLPVGPATPGRLPFEIATAVTVVLVALFPLYKPRPRRLLDTIGFAQKRVLLAVTALAAIGYFDYTYRLPRVTLILAGAFLLVAVPAWFVVIRRQPREAGGEAVIVGDDSESIADIFEATDQPILGYVSPPRIVRTDGPSPVVASQFTDGGSHERLSDLPCLGTLSQLDEVLVDRGVDTVIVAFAHPDRVEFFGALDTCYEHGVAAKVHRDHADSVLTHGIADGPLVDIDLEPWDWQDQIVKRGFDVAFAVAALTLTLPFALLVAVAIKLDDGGPVLYSQERTAAFGDTFTVYKFRTMVLGSEDAAPSDTEDDRVTRVGRLLRPTHLDEIPQLWSILRGDMSVVGPRAAWTEEEVHLEQSTRDWRKRWFVKPGLTGVAQIKGVSSVDPEQKLRYDVEYIRGQSLWFDLKIVVLQLWIVAVHVVETVTD